MASYDFAGVQVCNMMGYISDKTPIAGDIWENVKDSLDPSVLNGSELELYQALEAAQASSATTILYPTPYNEYTSRQCNILVSVYVWIDGDKFELGNLDVTFQSECI